MTTTVIDELEPAGRQAAERIIAALSELPIDVGVALVQFLGTSESLTLAAIASAFDTEDPVATLGRSLVAELWLGDAHDLAERLGDGPPWGAIRAALTELVGAFHDTRPGRMTALERRRRRQSWRDDG